MSQLIHSTEDRVFREETLEAYQLGVERAIGVMYDRLSEGLTVDNLADAAFMSRFHFSRVFARITGVSPARFLAAVRMQEAKRLLLKSDRSVTDICFDVGYNSLGTFTRTFADFVGFPPVRFRQLSHAILGMAIEDVVRFLPTARLSSQPAETSGEILCDRPLALITVALFPTAIPRSHPIECACLTDTRRFRFSRRPTRGARLFSAGMTPVANMEDAILLAEDRVFVGTASTTTTSADDLQVRLTPRRPVDPPIVVAFPLLIAESLMSQRMSILGAAEIRQER